MIDTSTWKEFRVGDYFHGVRGTSRKMQELNDGETPVIAAARYNQGIAGYYDVPSEYENAITISCNGVGCGSTYYHDYPFAITGDAIVLENIGNVPIGALHFIASVYDVYFSRKYSYTDKCSADKAEAEYISLPVTPDGQPDWDYMESYMKAVMEESEKSLENLRKADDTKHLIDVSGWGNIRIGDYFEVEYGTFRPKDKLGVGDYNYITTSGFNNGITDKIDVADHQGGCITVASDGALMGSAFYQEEPFSTSNIVSTLTPFETTPLNKYNAQFICALIFSKRSEFGWLGFKFSVDRVRNLIIKLPATSTGEPDWQYMEDYMKAVMEESEKSLEDLKIGGGSNDRYKHLDKKYVLGDLFDMQRGTGYSLKDLVEGNTPLISATTKNNSIVVYANVTPKFDAETITITTDGAGMGYATVQMKPFDIASNAVAVLPYGNNVGLYAKFFVCAVIRQYANRFSYKDKMNRDQLLQLEVYLPATSDGQPDWDYMESYMKAVMEESEKSLENLKKADDTKHLIDVSGWGEFDITELFDMSLPKGDLQVKKVDDGDIPLITPSNFNNGMIQRISEHSKSTLYNKGSLTVDMFGNAYYQEEDFFVTAHGHVNVLIPKMTLNVYTGTFLASTIRAMFFDKYGFNEMCTQKVLKVESIWLPITSDGQPDWDYMESYMKAVMEESEKSLENLKIGGGSNDCP